MKLWLDDERSVPDDSWTLCRWPCDVIDHLSKMAVGHCEVEVISLDHDLGDDERGTGYDVLLWIEEAVALHNFVPPVILIHTANASTRSKMEAACRSIKRFQK